MRHPRVAGGTALLILTALSACSTEMALPEPRPVVVYSGQRIEADEARMKEVSDWLTPLLDRIDLDPDFLIDLQERPETAYPWEGMEIKGDTVDLGLYRGAPDAQSPYLVYGFLELMEAKGTLEDVLPEAVGQSGYATERAILSRVAEVWLLGRAVYDTHPFGPLDELVYSEESGYLDEFIFATQASRFSDAAAEYQAANPSREADFQSWFRDTFDADGPRFVGAGEQQAEPETPAAAAASDSSDGSGAR